VEIFEKLLALPHDYPYIFWTISGCLLLIALLIYYREKIGGTQLAYSWMNFKTSFPLIGYVAKLTRQTQEIDVDLDTGTPWYRTERELCARYYRFYDQANKDPDYFDKCTNYLNKIGELGRTIGGIGLFISIILVPVEAYVFMLVVAPYVVTNVSANQAELMALGGSLVLSMILLRFTHAAGKVWHRNTLINNARNWHSQEKRTGKAQALVANHRVRLEHTEQDDDDPRYLHIANRMNIDAKFKPKWRFPIFVFGVICVLVVLMYYVRLHTVNSNEIEQINASPFAQLEESSSSPFGLPAMPDANAPLVLPDPAKQDNRQADHLAASEIFAEKIAAYERTFIILGILFFCVQVLGFINGKDHSFAGIESKKAADYIAGFNIRKEFETSYERKRDQVSRDADMHLSRLQRGIAQHHDLDGSSKSGHRRSFDLYVREYEQARAAKLNRVRDTRQDHLIQESNA